MESSIVGETCPTHRGPASCGSFHYWEGVKKTKFQPHLKEYWAIPREKLTVSSWPGWKMSWRSTPALMTRMFRWCVWMKSPISYWITPEIPSTLHLGAPARRLRVFPQRGVLDLCVGRTPCRSTPGARSSAAYPGGLGPRNRNTAHHGLPGCSHGCAGHGQPQHPHDGLTL